MYLLKLQEEMQQFKIFQLRKINVYWLDSQLGAKYYHLLHTTLPVPSSRVKLTSEALSSLLYTSPTNVTWSNPIYKTITSSKYIKDNPTIYLWFDDRPFPQALPK